MSTLFLFVGNLTPEIQQSLRQARTYAALRQAQVALIGYAARFRDTQNDEWAVEGYLPMPDIGPDRGTTADGNCRDAGLKPLEGCQAPPSPSDIASFAGSLPTMVGRLPWRTLGLPPLRDGDGECLWLIVSAPFLSGNYKATNPIPVNWDTTGRLELMRVDKDGALVSQSGSNAHERPVAVVVAPGAILGEQNRNSVAQAVECGGNYDPSNYLDEYPAGNIFNYLSTTKNASALDPTEVTPGQPYAADRLLVGGKTYSQGGRLYDVNCIGECPPVTNDIGLAITSADLFGPILGISRFRAGIDATLQEIKNCIGAGSTPATCLPTSGYGLHYASMITAVTGAGSYIVNTLSGCEGAVLFSGTRAAGQMRSTSTEIAIASNYFEGGNATTGGTSFSGTAAFDGTLTDTTSDVVKGINCPDPTNPGNTDGGGTHVQSSNLTANNIGQLTGYDAASQSITLGTPHSTNYGTSIATDLYGCTWFDSYDLTVGLRSYFTFTILESTAFSSGNPLDGFTFALADADHNGSDVCGAARQHLGYSGNNADTAFLAPPKIGLEVDTEGNNLRKLTGTTPVFTNPNGYQPGYRLTSASGISYLSNGRNDPLSTNTVYKGGHVAAVYWGGETDIDTGRSCSPSCASPTYCSTATSTCIMPSEDDDNVHGRSGNRSGYVAAPGNPLWPPTITKGAGAYNLDPNLSKVPVDREFHVRVELTRGPPVLGAVRVASTGNIDLSNPGATIDGVALAAGDRVLVKDQTTASANGVYVWLAASSALTRADDANTAGALINASVNVTAGTSHSGTWWRQTTARVVLGTDSVTWTKTQGIGSVAASQVLSARLASTGPVSLTAPDSSLDDVSLSTGDRVLLKDQTNAAENGRYVWDPTTSPKLKRATDADSLNELGGAIVAVRQGAVNANHRFRLAQSTFTLGTDSLRWTELQVKLAPGGNVALGSPGNKLDGQLMSIGDRLLLLDQVVSSENGIYIWNGSTSALTLASDAAASGTGTAVQVQQGTRAGSWWQQGSGGWQRRAVRVASQANLDLSAPGAAIDGISLTVGNQVLVRAQTVIAQNGLYVWQGAASAMTAVTGAAAITQVLEGMDAGRAYRQLTGTTTWAAIDPSLFFRFDAWVLGENNVDQIAAMKDLTRAMSQSYASFSPHLRDQPLIGYPFRRARLGLTIGQNRAATDQYVTVQNFSATALQ
ncbi:MAG: hypothetical protein IPG34_00125 [Rhodocyclaceae bacterium]|nr:hypothetical protein [Rhodocyclaceae bacterium]